MDLDGLHPRGRWSKVESEMRVFFEGHLQLGYPTNSERRCD